MASWKKSAHTLWVNRLRRVSSLREFLQVMNVDFILVLLIFNLRLVVRHYLEFIIFLFPII